MLPPRSLRTTQAKIAEGAFEARKECFMVEVVRGEQLGRSAGDLDRIGIYPAPAFLKIFCVTLNDFGFNAVHQIQSAGSCRTHDRQETRRIDDLIPCLADSTCWAEHARSRSSGHKRKFTTSCGGVRNMHSGKRRLSSHRLGNETWARPVYPALQ